MRKTNVPLNVEKKRKRKLLDERKRKEIIAIISVGSSRESAAKYVHCSPATIRYEMKVDNSFAEEIQAAEAHSEVYFLQRIRDAAKKEQYWRAAAWALERRCPNRYAARGAKTLSEEQVFKLITDLVEIVVPEIHDSNEKRNIIRKTKELIQKLNLQSEYSELQNLDFDTE